MGFETYYTKMTDQELLEDATNPTLLDGYRSKCKAVLAARLEAQNQETKL